MKNRLEIKALPTMILGLCLAAPFAMAANPHFQRADANLNAAGDLVVSWKEVGLGNNQEITYAASATATGAYACINRGGKNPQASNKQDFTGAVESTGTFTSGKNGQITASLTVSPPESELVCPGGQKRILACVTYQDITLEDTSNEVTADVPGSLAKTFFNLEGCP